jgi:hypothetical protein
MFSRGGAETQRKLLGKPLHLSASAGEHQRSLFRTLSVYKERLRIEGLKFESLDSRVIG